jgi:hypothetical protein
MADAVEAYARYRCSDDAWALGRFVVTAARLEELAAALRSLDPSLRGAGPWRVSAVLGPAAPVEDWARVEEFNRRTAEHGARVDSIEAKATTAVDAGPLLSLVPSSMQRYIEVPLDSGLAPLLSIVKAGGAFAKIRMGGLTPDAFPAADAVVGFLELTHRAGLAFKATAGLHHPLRGRYRLTYEPAAPMGEMYGFLNLFVASALAALGASSTEQRAALLEEDAHAFAVTGTALRWRSREIDARALARLRLGLHGFGSCSFREPIDELPQVGLG